MQTEVHDLTIWHDRHSLYGTLTDHQHTPKLRANIRRNAYDDQSHARVEAWTTEQGWKPVHSVPITNMRIGDYSYVHGDQDPERFAAGLLGRTGAPYWTDQMEADLDQLLNYGREFFA